MVGVVARRAARLVLTAMVTLILLPGSEAVGAALPVSASIAVGDTGHFAYDVAPRVAAALGSGAEAVESHPLAAGHAGSANMAAEDAAHLYDFQSDFVAPRALPAARQVDAAWGVSNYRHGGLMSGIEHINYRHAFDSGFDNVSRFAQGTSVRQIQGHVDDALRYGTVTPNGSSGYRIVYDTGSTLGTDVAGNAVSGVQVYVRDGVIQTAFPVAVP